MLLFKVSDQDIRSSVSVVMTIRRVGVVHVGRNASVVGRKDDRRSLNRDCGYHHNDDVKCGREHHPDL